MSDPSQSPHVEAPPPATRSSAGRSGFTVLAASGIVLATAFAAIATLASAKNNAQGQYPEAPAAATPTSDGPAVTSTAPGPRPTGKPGEPAPTTVVVTGADGHRTTTTLPPRHNGPGKPAPGRPGPPPPGNPRPPHTPTPTTDPTTPSTPSEPPSSTPSESTTTTTRDGTLPPPSG